MSSSYYDEYGWLSIDLHGCTQTEAKILLDQQIQGAPKGMREIRIIHGFNQGTALRDFVRGRYRHPRVIDKAAGINDGMTRFILRTKG